MSADKPAVFAEIARVLKPGGCIGISDLIADPAVTPAERTTAFDPVECLASSLTTAQYEAALRDAGLTGIEIRTTHQTGPGLHAAIIRATKPYVTVAAMTAAHADQVLAIYQTGIDEGNATFEITAPTWQAFDAAKLPAHRHVALDGHGEVLGCGLRCVRPVRVRGRRGALRLRPPGRPRPRRRPRSPRRPHGRLRRVSGLPPRG